MKRSIIPLVMTAFAFPAFAQGTDFESIDMDQSGGISLQEIQVVAPDVTEETFNAVDTDGSGDLSPEEFAAIVDG
ncbi:hypothetical protein [Chelativorans sp. M5D2P16]|uniref:hypothetical protein n=1 Tax=Chelativorans sp. M5D2P16 TaxID=3095678 RepID=UPI002AC9FB80|nr:hypothetical protein [Chelativorans sp. M5D2P16]MDZ5696899.1 hypothetical protein [Chelativorans sp. M5D2P16]